jgi:hypothetical protein
MSTELQVYDKQRLALLEEYKPGEHLMQWTAFDKRANRSQTVTYYPAAWRLYELSLRYPTANFSSDIIHMDAERDFVIVRARLYLGADYTSSEKKAEAYKQGRLTELDRVETKAKARAARDFGIGTEHALDLDDTPDNEVASTTVSEVQHVRSSIVAAQNGHAQIEAPKTTQTPEEALKQRLIATYDRALATHLFERGSNKDESMKAFLAFVSDALHINIAAIGQLTSSRLNDLEAYINNKDIAQAS